MASSAGSVFGAPATAGKGPALGGTSFGQNSAALGGTSFGQNSSAIMNKTSGVGAGTAGLFNFGGASQFGGIGGGAGTFQAGAASVLGVGAGAASSDDPYANIAIDLSKVKAAPKASKPFEKKTEEEKVKDAESRSGTIKSNLKTTKADFEKAAENKKGVRFGKSTTYDVVADQNDSGHFYNADMDKDGKGSPRPNKRKIVQEKDLSDGRDEADKIKEQLEKEKAAQLEEMKLMNEWKKKQDEKEKEGSAKNSIIEKMRMD